MTPPTKRPGFAARPADPEQWVKAADAPPPVTGSYTARLTIDITPELRGRIKIAAFQHGQTVTVMLRTLLAREFPATEGDAP